MFRKSCWQAKRIMYWAVIFKAFFSWPHLGIFVFKKKTKQNKIKGQQQQQTEPTSLALLWNIRSCSKWVCRPPKCHGYETELVEVKSNFYQTCSQKQLNCTKKNALNQSNGWNLVKSPAIENDSKKDIVVNNA